MARKLLLPAVMEDPTPHDTFFKSIFSSLEQAGALLRHILSAPWVAAIDWSTLRLAPTEGKDERGASHCDLMFEVRLRDGRPCVLFILLEHQSQPDQRMPWRVVGYTVARLTRWGRNNPKWKRLPAVLPIVLYHGTRPWTQATRLDELWDLPASLRSLRPAGLGMEFQLCELDKLLVGSPPSDPLLRVSLEALAFSRRPEIFDKIEGWGGSLSSVDHNKRLPIVRDTLNYLLGVRPAAEHRQLEARMRRHTLPDVIDYPTIKDHLIAQGREAGLDQGRQEGRQEGRVDGERSLLRQQIRYRFGELSPAQADRIEAADEETLTRWGRGIFEARSIEELLR